MSFEMTSLATWGVEPASPVITQQPKVNVIRMRRIFQSRLQQPSENEECYLRVLYTASEDCEFGALKRERIRD